MIQSNTSGAAVQVQSDWRHVSALRQIYASNGDSEVPGFLEGARSRDLVEPLSEEEQQRTHPWSWLKWWGPLCSSLTALSRRVTSSPALCSHQAQLLLRCQIMLPAITCPGPATGQSSSSCPYPEWARDHGAEPSQMLSQRVLALVALSKCPSSWCHCRLAATSPFLPAAQVCHDAQPHCPERAAPQQHAQLWHARAGPPAGPPLSHPCLLPCEAMQA